MCSREVDALLPKEEGDQQDVVGLEVVIVPNEDKEVQVKFKDGGAQCNLPKEGSSNDSNPHGTSKSRSWS